MAQSLFSGTPANLDQDAGSPGITVATRIRFAVDGTARIRWWFPTTPLSGSAQWLAVLYDYATDSPTGPGLGSGLFQSQTPGTWNLADATFNVSAGDEVVLEVWNADGRYVNTLDFFLLDVVVDSLTGPAEEDPARYNGRFDQGGAITFPENGFRANGYWVDVLFEPDSVDTDSTLTATAGLSAAGVLSRFGAGTLDGTAGLTAAGLAERVDVGTLSGTAGLSAAAMLALSGAAPLAGIAGLSATAAAERYATASLAGVAGLSAVASVTTPGGTITRPNTGTIARPSAGTILRPNTGIITRP